MKLIRVALPVPLHRYFDYLPLENSIPVKGARVVVPFGKQTKVGIVVDFPQTSDVPIDKLKPIQTILDAESVFDEKIWQLLIWAARYYHAPIGEVLNSALPIKLRNGDSTILPSLIILPLPNKDEIRLLSARIKKPKNKWSF